jgi:hypothetical protein
MATFALPEATVVRRELGVPKSRWPGDPRRNVEELFWDTIAQVRGDLAGIQRKKVLHFMHWIE